ncbi:unnamed protein product [Orchesella dallaii]|uniref:Uncharacterized protein n=1 Tax=Orchesella dallaii TaxID=48710 RepID=A0ABP1QZ36_9HEXA
MYTLSAANIRLNNTFNVYAMSLVICSSRSLLVPFASPHVYSFQTKRILLAYTIHSNTYLLFKKIDVSNMIFFVAEKEALFHLQQSHYRHRPHDNHDHPCRAVINIIISS